MAIDPFVSVTPNILDTCLMNNLNKHRCQHPSLHGTSFIIDYTYFLQLVDSNSLNYDHVHIPLSLPLLQEWENMDSGCDGWMKFHRSLIVAHVACGGFLG